MRDISAEIAAIQVAAHGSEVRSSIINALNEINYGALQAVAESDAGKILYVNANGQWAVGNEQYVPTPTGAINIDTNGTYDVTNKASAVVNVSGGGGTLGTKTITENGTYNAGDDNLDGYSQVTVNVTSSGSTDYEWDFTTGANLVDSIGGRLTAILHGNAAYNSEKGGILIPDSTSAIEFPMVLGARRRYYVTFGEFGVTSYGFSNRFFGFGSNNDNYPSRGFGAYTASSYILQYSASTAPISEENYAEYSALPNSTIGLQVGRNNDGSAKNGFYAIKPDSTSVYGSHGAMDANVNGSFYVGSPSNTRPANYPMVVKKVKITHF